VSLVVQCEWVVTFSLRMNVVRMKGCSLCVGLTGCGWGEVVIFGCDLIFQ
jgi:hypothetical protein